LTHKNGYGSLDALPLTKAVKAFPSAFNAAPTYDPKILGTLSSNIAIEFRYKSSNPIVVNASRPPEIEQEKLMDLMKENSLNCTYY
jgi:hypothetical protein